VDDQGTTDIVERVIVSSGIGRDTEVVVFRDIDEEGTFIYKFIKHR